MIESLKGDWQEFALTQPEWVRLEAGRAWGGLGRGLVGLRSVALWGLVWLVGWSCPARRGLWAL